MAMTFSTNGHDYEHDYDREDAPERLAAPPDEGANGAASYALEDMVRGEIGDLTAEFRRTVDRVGDRINGLIEAEMQKAFAEMLSVGGPVVLAGPVEDARVGDARANGKTLHIDRATLVPVEAPATPPEPATDATEGTTRSAAPVAVGDGPAPEEGKLYEGLVSLQVRASGCTCQSMQFVRAVSRMPELRVLRLVGTAGSGLELLVGLKEPVRLEVVLGGMDRVASVRATIASAGSEDGEGPAKVELAVWLVDSPSSHGA